MSTTIAIEQVSEEDREAIKQVEERVETALEAPRRSDPEGLAHHQAQVEASDVHEIALEDVFSPAQVHATHRAGLQAVSEDAFEHFTSSAHQSLAASGRDPAPVRVRPSNGTPHFTEIDGAFREQGFPGF